MSAFSVECMVREPDVLSFADAQELWAWLANHHETQHGGWVQKAGIVVPSIGFHDLLEAGIAYGWSESTPRAHDTTSYLQRFTPLLTAVTTSPRSPTASRRRVG